MSFRSRMARMLHRTRERDDDRTASFREYREALNRTARKPKLNGHAPDLERVREVMKGKR